MPDAAATLARRRASPASSAVTRVAAGVRARPRATAVGCLWVIGLVLAFLAPAPVAITKTAAAAYDAALADAARSAAAVAAAERDAARAHWAAREATPWFWRLRGPDVRDRVVAARAAASAADARLEARLASTDAALRRGKAALGLWSDAGVAEAKQLYRAAFAQGKVFARRETFWAALVRLLHAGRDDRHPAVALVELIAQTVVNFALGAVGSVFLFAAALPRLVASYGAGFLSAAAFYAVALLAAASVAATFCVALAASGAATAYGVVSVAGGRLALGGGGQPPNAYTLPPRARPRAPLWRAHAE